MIRLATQDDIPQLLALAEHAHSESLLQMFVFNEERVEEGFKGVLKVGPEHGLLLVAQEGDKFMGFLAGVKNYASTTLEQFATLLVWYVAPEARVSRIAFLLFDGFEYWAKNVCKASGITAGNEVTDTFQVTDRFYKHRGFVPLEQTYLKEID